MRRRFGSRGRRGSADSKDTPIDAARWLTRIVEAGLVPVSALEPMESEGVAASYAALGKGEQEDGKTVVVAFSPTSGGNAALAALAAASGMGTQGEDGESEAFAGRVIAIAPHWSQADTRRLGAFRDIPFDFQTLAAPQLAEEAGVVAAELPADPVCLSAEQVAAHIVDAAHRALFLRAASSLAGLAAKHGGAIRGVGTAVELVLLGRRVAELRIDAGVVLNTILPLKTSARLSEDDLAEAFDRFEGQLRKRLNDRKVRDGEEGMRARVIPLLSRARGLRGSVSWPLGGADRDAVDVVGIDEEGYPVIAAIRAQLTLAEFGVIVDAALALRLSLPLLFVEARPPVRLESPRVAFAAQEFAAPVVRILPQLALGYDLFEVRTVRGRGFELAEVTSGNAPPIRTRSASRSTGGRAERSRSDSEASGDSEAEDGTREGGRGRGDGRRPARDGEDGRGRGRSRRRGRGSRASADDGPEPVQLDEAESDSDDSTAEPSARRRGRGRGRGRSRQRGGSGDEAAGDTDAASESGERGQPSTPQFDEMSFFDLDDDSRDRDAGDGEARPKRRGRSRRRGGRRPSGEGGSDSSGSGDASEGSGRSRASGASDDSAGADPAGIDEDVDADDLEETLALLPDDISDLQLNLPKQPSYDDDEDSEAGDAAATSKKEVVPDVEPEPVKQPRRRAAIVAHADRDSLIAAVMLARDIRLLEGLWIYPQSELMTFFRSVAVDLREGTPVYLIGFTPSPARDVLQSAALFSGRLTWFDHHEWPPEDLEATRQITGEDNLHVTPGAGSSLPAVLEQSTRRSRFSDKLVDLATARFTQHDFERWGRLWMSRLARIAETVGERRSDIDALLSGRPSDLAKEAALVEKPPVPPEVEFVSSRDFRLVHFSGHRMVVLDLPAELDGHLASRIARERYDATLSLALVREQGLVVLAASEGSGRRSTNLGAMVDHLAAKLGWIQALPDADYVARFQIADLDEFPERLDDTIGIIAMGRSIIER